MANLVDPVTTTNKILTEDNIRISMFNEGRIINELTEAAAYAIINADNTVKMLVHITETNALEYWFVKGGQLIRRTVA